MHAGYESATDAAEALGVPYPTYAGHENGSSGFRSDKGLLYARRFKVNFEWLMSGRGPMVSPAHLDPEENLRFALLEYGVPEADLDRAVAVIKALGARSEAKSEQSRDDDQSRRASRPREVEPLR
jgi:hypothetical protein